MLTSTPRDPPPSQTSPLCLAGPLLTHLPGCATAIASLTAAAPRLKSLSLSRYDLGSLEGLTASQHLTSLVLLQCNLSDQGLVGISRMSRLQHLELCGNNLSSVGLCEVAKLSQLVRPVIHVPATYMCMYM